MPTYPQTVMDDIDGIKAQLRDLVTKVGSIPSDATEAPWLAAASLGSGWTDVNPGTDTTVAPIGFQVRPGAEVRMRGAVIRAGSAWPAAGFTVLTLPTGLYPVWKQGFETDSPFGNGWVKGEVRSDGSVRIWGWGGGTTGNAGTAIGLDGITYRLA